MASSSWDEEGFVLDPLEEEEEYVAPKVVDAPAPSHTDGGDDELALLVDLSALVAAQPSLDFTSARERVIDRLREDWSTNSGELMAAGLCWNIPLSRSDDVRREREAQAPGTVFTVVHYPNEINGVNTLTLMDVVGRRTPWEVLDALKVHVAESIRPLKWQADLALELEELAEEEASWAEEREEMRAAGEEVEDGAEEAEDVVSSAEQSLLDILLDLIFEHYPREGLGWAEHAVLISQRKAALRRMWRSTFGRLPEATELTLKHAPRRPPPRQGTAARPKLLVPGPPGGLRAPRPADVAARRTSAPGPPSSSPRRSSPREPVEEPDAHLVRATLQAAAVFERGGGHGLGSAADFFG
jgi:FtsZ-binding cell division protein ZapB